MGDIFTPWMLGGVLIKNRLVRSATWEGLAEDDGSPTPVLGETLARLARNEVGLVITGFAYVRPDGKGRPRQTGVYDDALLGPLSALAGAVKKAGAAVAMQIAHAGAETRAEWSGHQPAGPSAHFNQRLGQEARALSREEIWDLVACFARAAGRVREAGFDAVELHAAHGYLLSQFLSPLYNRRQDDFGGELEGRSRFLREVYSAVRGEVGPDYPVFIKLNSRDGQPGGLDLEESLEVVRRLDEMGLDAVEVSGGILGRPGMSPSRQVKGHSQGYFLESAGLIREAVSCPVISVGGHRTREGIEKALDLVDAVALCRPFIRQPDLARRWKEGSREDPACLSCTKCIAATEKHGLSCGLAEG